MDRDILPRCTLLPADLNSKSDRAVELLFNHNPVPTEVLRNCQNFVQYPPFLICWYPRRTVCYHQGVEKRDGPSRRLKLPCHNRGFWRNPRSYVAWTSLLEKIGGIIRSESIVAPFMGSLSKWYETLADISSTNVLMIFSAFIAVEELSAMATSSVVDSSDAKRSTL